jgi:hypothetical protein
LAVINRGPDFLIVISLVIARTVLWFNALKLFGAQIITPCQAEIPLHPGRMTLYGHGVV